MSPTYLASLMLLIRLEGNPIIIYVDNEHVARLAGVLVFISFSKFMYFNVMLFKCNFK